MKTHLRLHINAAFLLFSLAMILYANVHASATAKVAVRLTGSRTISDRADFSTSPDITRETAHRPAPAFAGITHDRNVISQASGTFTLVNADTDQDIKEIVNGEVIYLPDNVNINMRFNPIGTPQSVRFTLFGGSGRTETQPPYAIAGDNSGNYNTWDGVGQGISGAAWPSYLVNGKLVEAEAVEFYFDIVREAVTNECAGAGTILAEYWEGVSGDNVSAIPLNSNPAYDHHLENFEEPATSDVNYGARIHGYICPPVSGNYTFWIASNDHSELWLSTDDDPSHKVMIAHISGATNPRQWDKFPTQKSVPITLMRGQRYYILALHKQGVGTSNLAVGWQLPSGTMERPIPGSRLSPASREGNTNPLVTITSPASGESFFSPATINITANATDEDGEIMMVDFFAKNMIEGTQIHLGQDNSAPYGVVWPDVQPGFYSITAEATDSDGGWSTHTVTVELGGGNDSAGITWDFWDGIQGNSVSDIPLDSPPDRTSLLYNFEAPVNIGMNYGSRIRGFLVAPTSGDYHFFISSNDHSELWLSTDQNPGNKVRIAHITGATNFHQFDKFSSQRSAAIPLVAGERYYIEVLHKQGVGTDHITVGWKRPDTAFDPSIDGDYLLPFPHEEQNATARLVGTDAGADNQFSQINVYPNPMRTGDLELRVGGFDRISQSVATYVEVMNISGEVVHAERLICGGNCGTYVMNINKGLVPGVYVVKMNTNGTMLHKRLLVK